MDEDDWLKEFLLPPGNLNSNPTRSTLIPSVQPVTVLVAPITPARGTVADLTAGVRRMSLDRNPTYFGVGDVTSGASSSTETVVTPDLANALHQMATGVAALANSLGGGTAQLTRGTMLTGDPQFPAWDWQTATLLGWISETTRMKEIRNVPDDLAIRYARFKLDSKLQEVYPATAAPETW